MSPPIFSPPHCNCICVSRSILPCDQVINWFAERSDRILLLFDAHKLDISDEFKSAIESLKGNDDKIRVVLNKADMDQQALLRVYGALMWSLGKVINTPEVPRVYVGSFWEKPLKCEETKSLLAREMRDLLVDLRALPRGSILRRINELVKRARTLKVHCHILSHLRDQFGWFGREKTQARLLKELLNEFKVVQKARGLPMGDFPHPAKFREILTGQRIDQYPPALSSLSSSRCFFLRKLQTALPSPRTDFRSWTRAVLPAWRSSCPRTSLASWRCCPPTKATSCKRAEAAPR